MRHCLACLLAAVFSSPMASGATFTVSNTNDAGAGSFRQAVLSANTSAGADVVDLTGVAGTIVLTSGQIEVTDTLTIRGPGAQVLAISGGGTSRLIEQTAGDNLAINDLTLRDGFTTSSGAAILARSVTLENVTVSDTRGGFALYLTRALVVRHSTITRNQAGGIQAHATALIEDSIISHNTSTAGAALFVEYEDAELHRVRIEDNAASKYGGAIWAFLATVEMTQCVIARNTAVEQGGAFMGAYRGQLVMDETRITGNRAAFGGGIYTYIPAVITRSEISDNQATVDGGGILGAATIENSTLSGNRAGRYGGGISLDTGHGKFVHTTIVGNQAAEGGGMFIGSGPGHRATLVNSILAGNTAPSGPDFGGGATLAASYSLIGNTSSNATLLSTDPNRLNVDPLLGPLQDNGGLTWTHLPAPDSPVINAGGPISPPLTHPTDQRTSPRPFGPAADLGALEVQMNAEASDIPALTPALLVLLTIVCGVAGVTALRT